MSDQQITCSECGGVFVFTEAEQQFYETKGLAAPPKRCKACRQARRAAREGGAGAENGRGGGGGFSGGGGGGGNGNGFGAPRGGGFGPRQGAAPRRFSNDANEYRAPMNGGAGDRGPGAAPRAGGFNNARGQRPARPGFGPPQPGGFRSNGNGAEARPAFNRGDDRPRGNFNGPPQGAPQGEYRGPSRDRGQWGTGGNAGGGFAPRAGGNDRPRRAEGGFNGHAAPRPERVPQPPSDDPRQTRPRAERPRFDITCAECGTQSQVPFKPLEGRQVFCQTCYRARKGTATAEAGAAEASEAPESDLGIVE